MYPGVPAAVVDRNLRCRKIGIRKRADGHADSANLPFFGVKEISPADRTKPEPELRALIPCAYVFGSSTKDFVRRRKARQRREHAAGSSLAGEAMTNANAARSTFNFNAQLSAGARGGSGRHGGLVE